MRVWTGSGLVLGCRIDKSKWRYGFLSRGLTNFSGWPHSRIHLGRHSFLRRTPCSPIASSCSSNQLDVLISGQVTGLARFEEFQGFDRFNLLEQAQFHATWEGEDLGSIEPGKEGVPSPG